MTQQIPPGCPLCAMGHEPTQRPPKIPVAIRMENGERRTWLAAPETYASIHTALAIHKAKQP